MSSAKEVETSGPVVTPPAIGPRLQAFRKAKSMTLEQLAEVSGVSRSMLSEIERGRANPTYATLWHLTRALETDLNSLLQGAREQNPGSIYHQTENLTPIIRSADGTCTLQILSPASMVSQVEWYLLRFDPKGQLNSQPHGAGTTEHIHCLEGEIIVRSGGLETVVRPGETARYAADAQHTLTSPTGAKAFLVVASGSVPATGSRRPSR